MEAIGLVGGEDGGVDSSSSSSIPHVSQILHQMLCIDFWCGCSRLARQAGHEHVANATKSIMATHDAHGDRVGQQYLPISLVAF